MQQLKLIAFDAEDLGIVSAHLQDAVIKVGDLTYRPLEKRFAAIANRFDWAGVHSPGGQGDLRHRTALRFERVLRARFTGFDPKQTSEFLSLLAVTFKQAGADDPAGTVTMTFAGTAAVQLDVECLEAELRDLGPAWQARSRPRHPDGGASEA